MKKVMSLLLAGAMIASLAACGSSSSSTASTASTASSAASSSSGETIKVGLLAPETGDLAQYGMAVRNGAMLYIKELNAKGGINGKQIEVIEYDEKGDSSEAVTAFTKMVSEGITALIGDVTTGPTLAVAAESASYNMPMITASGTAAAITYDEESKTLNENVFRACFIDPFQGTKMADYAYNVMGYRTAATLYETGNDYAEGLNNSFVEEFEKLGGKVTRKEAYSKGDTSFTAQLTNISGDNVDVIWCPNYYEDAGKIVTQARQVGIKAPIFGGDGWSSIEGYASAADLEGSIYCSGYADGSNADWEAAYKAEYGEKYPNMFAPLGYDAAMTMCNAIAVAESKGLKAGSDEYKAAVIEAMASSETKGVTGTYTYDEYHNPVKQAAMMELKSGVPTFKEMY